jgi:hypothetical protein
LIVQPIQVIQQIPNSTSIVFSFGGTLLDHPPLTTPITHSKQ